MKNAMKPPRQESSHRKNETNHSVEYTKNNRASMVPAFVKKRSKEMNKSGIKNIKNEKFPDIKVSKPINIEPSKQKTPAILGTTAIYNRLSKVNILIIMVSNHDDFNTKASNLLMS